MNTTTRTLLSHIHAKAIQQLHDRFDGWLCDFTGEEDDRQQLHKELVQVIDLLEQPAPGSGRMCKPLLEQQLARCLINLDFLDWAAKDSGSETKWNPQASSYKEFLVQYPEAVPYTKHENRALQAMVWAQFLLSTPKSAAAR